MIGVCLVAGDTQGGVTALAEVSCAHNLRADLPKCDLLAGRGGAAVGIGAGDRVGVGVGRGDGRGGLTGAPRIVDSSGSSQRGGPALTERRATVDGNSGQGVHDERLGGGVAAVVRVCHRDSIGVLRVDRDTVVGGVGGPGIAGAARRNPSAAFALAYCVRTCDGGYGQLMDNDGYIALALTLVGRVGSDMVCGGRSGIHRDGSRCAGIVPQIMIGTGNRDGCAGAFADGLRVGQLYRGQRCGRDGEGCGAPAVVLVGDRDTVGVGRIDGDDLAAGTIVPRIGSVWAACRQLGAAAYT